jgi:cobaltochelatase CobS
MLTNDCIVATANTFGTGADRVYVGSLQIDGATLDRFAFLEWPYDEGL